LAKISHFLDSIGRSIKEREACRGKEQKTWYKWHIFENLKLYSFRIWNKKNGAYFKNK